MKFDIHILVALTLLPQIVLASDPATYPEPDSGIKYATITPKGEFDFHAENVVRGGQSWDLDIVRVGKKKYKEKNKILNPCFVNTPQEQPYNDHYAGIKNRTPPAGYENGGVIGWIVAVNHGSSEGSVLLRALRVWEVSPDGARTLLTDEIICKSCGTTERVGGHRVLRTAWTAWDPVGDHSDFEIIDDPITGGDQEIVRIPTSDHPDFLFHLWNTTWPKPAVKAGWYYEIEAEVLPQGAGMIQVGLDFWKTPEAIPVPGGPTMNVEAAHSSWICSTGDSKWITVRAGGTQ